jgi:hypothetical protein
MADIYQLTIPNNDHEHPEFKEFTVIVNPSFEFQIAMPIDNEEHAGDDEL